MAPLCPECNSQKTWKDGLRYVQGKPIQRYLCRCCGFRFTGNNYKECQTTYSHQICALETERVKNLVRVKTKTEALREMEHNTKGQIVSFAWNLKKLGRKEETIKTYTKHIKKLAKHGELNDPESVKSVSQPNTKTITLNV